MKRLLLLSSLFMGCAFFVLSGCKAKKSVNVSADNNSNQNETKEEVASDNNQTKERIIHQPGTLNQKQLDSIKAVRMKEKRQYKK